MIINKHELLALSPIKNMLGTKEREHGVSHGLAEVGYDIRIKQDIIFKPMTPYGKRKKKMHICVDEGPYKRGNFTIASALEEFQMPNSLAGVVHDKSTWIRRGLSVFNTVIEPGWDGFLTLELAYHGREELKIPAGAGIAQVIFHRVSVPALYEGKYQGQADRPVEAIFEKE